MDKHDCNHHPWGSSIVRSHLRLLALGSSEAGQVLAADPKMWFHGLWDLNWCTKFQHVSTIARQTGLQVASASSCGRKVLHGEVEEILPGSVQKIWVPIMLIYSKRHTSMPIYAHYVPHFSQKLEVWYGFAWYVQAMQPKSANALPRAVWSSWDSGAVRWIISRAANWPWPFAVRCRWTTFVPPWKVRRDGNTSPVAAVAMEETVG